MSNALEKLKEFTYVVADTGDFELLEKYKPQDATTNPTLIFSALKQEKYNYLVDDAIKWTKEKSPLKVFSKEEEVEWALDKVYVNFGCEVLKRIPGRVSTEFDPRLSFDIEGSVARVKRIINMYKEMGIDKERVLFKLSSTWEGIQAAKILEKENIHCNMTLMFSVVQAAAAAEAGVTIISPFVGRITDFYKQKEGKQDWYEPEKDPGVSSVKNIYNYVKTFGYKTAVMGASFRNVGQVLELAGCDYLTLSPALLEELSKMPPDKVTRKLWPEISDNEKASEMLLLDQKSFLWQITKDEMASTKLSEGIRKFVEDVEKLEHIIKQKLSEVKLTAP
jgi:transaldolase